MGYEPERIESTYQCRWLAWTECQTVDIVAESNIPKNTPMQMHCKAVRRL